MTPSILAKLVPTKQLIAVYVIFMDFYDVPEISHFPKSFSLEKVRLATGTGAPAARRKKYLAVGKPHCFERDEHI